MNFKKIISLVIGATLMVSVVACSSAKTTDTKKTENKVVKFWGGGFAETSSWYDEFKKENGASIECKVSWVDMPKMLSALASGNPPDVAFINMSSVTELAAQNALRSIDDLGKNKEIDFSDFNKNIFELAKYKDKHYALPWDVQLRMLYFNKDLFTAAGLDAEKPPTTWDKLKENAKALTKFDANGAPIQLGFKSDDTSPFVMQSGGFYLSDDGLKSTANRPEVLKAMNLLFDLRNIYGGDKKLTPGAKYDIRQGNVAMTVDDAVWGFGDLNSNFKNLNFMVAPLPTEKEGTAVRNNGWATWGIVMPAKSANPEMGAKWAKYLATKGVYNIESDNFTKDPTKYSPRLIASATATKRVNDELMSKVTDTKLKARVAVRQEILEKYTKFEPISPAGQTASDKRNDVWKKVWAGEKTAEEGLQQMDKDVQGFIDTAMKDRIEMGVTK